jgi:hypothetical protein
LSAELRHFLPGENALHFHLTVSQQEENCIGELETFQEGKQMMFEGKRRREIITRREKK